MKKLILLIFLGIISISCNKKVLPQPVPRCPTGTTKFILEELQKLTLTSDKLTGSVASLNGNLTLARASEHEVDEEGRHVFDVQAYALSQGKVVYILVEPTGNPYPKKVSATIYRGGENGGSITLEFGLEENIEVVEVMSPPLSAGQLLSTSNARPEHQGVINNGGYVDEEGYFRHSDNRYFVLNPGTGSYQLISGIVSTEEQVTTTGRYKMIPLTKNDVKPGEIGNTASYLETAQGALKAGKGHLVRNVDGGEILKANELLYLDDLVYQICGDAINISAPTVGELQR